MKANKKIIIGSIAAALLVVLGIIVIRRKKTGDVQTTPEPEPTTGTEPEVPIVEEPPYQADPVLNPEPPVEYPTEPAPELPELPPPDPMKPVLEPAKGVYYAVQKDDTMYGLLATAGYPAGATRYKAYTCMLNHERNAWIGQTNANDGSRILRFLRHFAANPGYENKSWAWSTSYVSAASPDNKWPVVWIPEEGEVGA